ncbi:MAG: 50S ribosomal protein L10 [Phycisphaeraceae bacterium]|nr:50S ribosomal protein L10 [Phycisphaeraceae bacterium]
MSKTVKSMIMRDYTTRVGDVKDGMLISIRGLKAIDTTKLRNNLAKHKVKVTVIRNSLAKKQFKGTSFEKLETLLTGPSALVLSQTSVVEAARSIVGMLKDFPTLELKGAILDGTLFEGKKGVEELSKYPTREEAIGQAVTLIVSPGKKLLAQVKGPGSNVAGIIKAIEAKLEKGEAIAKV